MQFVETPVGSQRIFGEYKDKATAWLKLGGPGGLVQHHLHIRTYQEGPREKESKRELRELILWSVI